MRLVRNAMAAAVLLVPTVWATGASAQTIASPPPLSLVRCPGLPAGPFAFAGNLCHRVVRGVRLRAERLYAANRAVIGRNPNRLRRGTILVVGSFTDVIIASDRPAPRVRSACVEGGSHLRHKVAQLVG